MNGIHEVRGSIPLGSTNNCNKVSGLLHILADVYVDRVLLSSDRQTGQHNY